MTKYRVDYKLMGLGHFFVEVPSISQAYEQMYESFAIDNSLIVRAKYPYGFEILGRAVHVGEFPKPSSMLVTTLDELRKAKQLELIKPVASVGPPPVLADTGLFEFDGKSEVTSKTNK